MTSIKPNKGHKLGVSFSELPKSMSSSSFKLCLLIVTMVSGFTTCVDGQRRRQSTNQKPLTVEECHRRLIDADKNVQYLLVTGRDPSEVVIPRNLQELDEYYCK